MGIEETKALAFLSQVHGAFVNVAGAVKVTKTGHFLFLFPPPPH